MLTDYKIKKSIDDGSNKNIVTSFYEGTLELKLVAQSVGTTLVQKQVYERTQHLKQVEYTFNANLTNATIRIELNKELAKDTTRTPINEQK